MSDNENNVSNEQVDNQTSNTEAQTQTENAEVVAMREHQAKLLDELKQTKTKLNAFEERESQIEAERLEKAKQANDFKQLHEDAMKKLEESKNQYAQLQAQISQEKITNAAQSIAAELGNDPISAKLLGQLITSRLKYNDGDIQVLNASGELTVSTIDQFKAEIMNTPDYQPLLKGNHSSGGDASQVNNSKASADSKTIPAAEYDAMDPLARSKMICDGYTRGEE